jgi:hypothetical protein
VRGASKIPDIAGDFLASVIDSRSSDHPMISGISEPSSPRLAAGKMKPPLLTPLRGEIT